MVEQWQPGTEYNYGSVVEYQCNTYKIIQPHRSQSDWTPPATPALWGRVPHHDSAPQQQNNPDKEWHEHTTTHVEPIHDERQKPWYELDDQRKKQVEIGGGLLAGAALLGGGFALFNHHKKEEEEKKADIWALQNWVHDAQARTQHFYQSGGNISQGQVIWVLAHGKQIPRGAIVGGNDKGHTIFIARAFQDGGIQVGKACDWFPKGAVIGYQREEIQLDTYEVLIGDPNAVQWIFVSGEFNLGRLNGARPIEGGRENNGKPIYIAKAPYHGAEQPGKIEEGWGGAYVPYGGKEQEVKEYQVLCYSY